MCVYVYLYVYRERAAVLRTMRNTAGTCINPEQCFLTCSWAHVHGFICMLMSISMLHVGISRGKVKSTVVSNR